MLRLSKFCTSIEYFDVESNAKKTIVYSTRLFHYVCVSCHDWHRLEQGYVDHLDKRTKIELIKARALVDESEDEVQSVCMQEGLIVRKVSSLYHSLSLNEANEVMTPGFTHTTQAMLEQLTQKILPTHTELVILWLDVSSIKHIDIIQTLTPTLQWFAQQHQLDYYSDILTLK